jgi:hypothetical protein
MPNHLININLATEYFRKNCLSTTEILSRPLSGILCEVVIEDSFIRRFWSGTT